MLSSLATKALRCLPAETAHDLSITLLSNGVSPYVTDQLVTHPSLECEVAGLKFKNPVGLAAGYDKNATAVGGLLKFGFSHLELGGVTKIAQAGNPKPRMFRLPEDQAIIQRMGFNGVGLEKFVENLTGFRQKFPDYAEPIGINLGKNKETQTPAEDYAECARAVAPYADYVTINVSSPNTPGLRDLQHGDELQQMIEAVQEGREQLQLGRPLPIMVKVAPDLEADEIAKMAKTFVELNVDAVIAGNTSLWRPEGLKNPNGEQQGGLSGVPLFERSNFVLREFAKNMENKVPLIGLGGIFSAEDAYKKIRLGASMVQIYTGLVYKGPRLVRDVNEGLIRLLATDGYSSVAEAVGVDL